MCTETSYDLSGRYPADLEIVDICKTDHEIQIKIIAHSNDYICPKCGAIQPIIMEPMKEKFRIFQSLGKPHGF